MSQRLRKLLVPLIILFLVINSIVFIVDNQFSSYKVESNILLITNVILFILSVVHLVRSVFSLKNTNPHEFTKIFYSGFVIRLFVCTIAAFIYIYLRSPQVHKITLFSCMAIYLIYSFVEAGLLKSILKMNKKDGES
ncbi:MAG: hypothetical protein E6Q95_04070 [Chitinophagaceae bacterium]|nr:MAG: hypothetical protein E6Q95_04070 [Chitinophagaceae bacterium]